MTPDRRLHFVGTLPQFTSASDVFAWQTGALDGRLRRLSGGETGERLQWFVPLVKELQRSPAIRTLRHGDWSSYTDRDRLAVRHGQRLTPDAIPLHLARWADEELRLLDAAGTPATATRPLQIGVPGYLDIALFTFGPVGGARLATVFLSALAAQIERIVALARDRVIFQLESPAALIAVASTPPVLQAMMAAAMARLVTAQAKRSPVGTRFGIHLCLGDLGHRAAVQLPDAGPLVRLTNALARRWPADRDLEFVHLPLSGADQAPVTEPGYYTPLRRLRESLPQLVAGIAHEDLSRTEQRRVRELVETAASRPVDIATACGLGRRDPDQAERAVERMLDLID